MANRKKRRKKKHIGGIILGVLLVIALLGLGSIILGMKLFEAKTGESLQQCIAEGREIAANSKREDFTKDKISYIYADDGTQIAELSENNESSYIEYEDIPEAVIDAFVSVEDRTFWTNKGVDMKGMVRVLWTFIKSRGETANGASTITQQLVKLTYLSSEKTLSRKVKEIVISLAITKQYSKEDIIEFYCNTCCFANGIYGIQDAAEKYFDKSVDELSLSEIAYLCAIPNRPEYYNPKTNPENALTRRDKILDDMLEEGYITQAQCDEAKAESISIAEVSEKSEMHNYETTYAMNCAIKYLMQVNDFEFRYSFDDESDYEEYQDQYQEAYSQAKHELETGGYEVYTTINMEQQAALQDILDEQLSDQTAKLDTGVYQVQGSMTVIDNETGKVVAVIGGRSQEETSQTYTLNRVYQGYQQPGSSIKPLVVYTPALDTGEYMTNSQLNNIDVDSAKSMKVSQIAEMSGEKVTMRHAVEQSLNGCAYWLFSNIGISTGLDHLAEMGFSKIVPDDYNMSACLGGLNYGVTTEEMANAYYTLENGGIYQDTDCIESIIRDGEDIYEDPEEKQVYGEEACLKMTDIMKGVLTSGTAKKSKWYKYTDTEAAGKTGTTNDNKSAWFCGYTPYYTISVWVGCDTPTKVSGLSGSSYPLSIWKESMLYMIQDLPAASFPGMPEEEEVAETEETEECICDKLCTADDINDECPVCGENYLDCKGIDVSECICEEKCEGDSVYESCPVCVQNPALCQGLDMTCTCIHKCTAESVNTTCNLCAQDYRECCAAEEAQPEASEKKETDSKGSSDSGSDTGNKGSSDSGTGGSTGSDTGNKGSSDSGSGGSSSDSGSNSDTSGNGSSGSGDSGSTGNGDTGSNSSTGGSGENSSTDTPATTSDTQP